MFVLSSAPALDSALSNLESCRRTLARLSAELEITEPTELLPWLVSRFQEGISIGHYSCALEVHLPFRIASGQQDALQVARRRQTHVVTHAVFIKKDLRLSACIGEELVRPSMHKGAKR